MNNHIWTIVLAAGESKRFDGIKALAKWKDGTLLFNAIEISQKFSGQNTIVVTGAHHELIIKALPDIYHAHNSNWKNGMGSSIACGVEKITRLDNDTKAILVVSIDQPLITQMHLNNILQKSLETGLCTLSTDGNIDSPPAVIPSAYFNLAKKLTGEGLKKSLDKYEKVHNPAAIRDADTKDELAALLKTTL